MLKSFSVLINDSVPFGFLLVSGHFLRLRKDLDISRFWTSNVTTLMFSGG